MTARPSGAFCSPPSPEPERHRQHADDHRQRRHDHGAQAGHSGGQRRVVGVGAFLALIVGEGDHQNAVRGRHADAHDRAHERRDVDRRLGDEQHPDDARQGARQRHEDDERIEPGLEVDDHQQVDEDDGEHHAVAQAR